MNDRVNCESAAGIQGRGSHEGRGGQTGVCGGASGEPGSRPAEARRRAESAAAPLRPGPARAARAPIQPALPTWVSEQNWEKPRRRLCRVSPRLASEGSEPSGRERLCHPRLPAASPSASLVACCRFKPRRPTAGSTAHPAFSS